MNTIWYSRFVVMNNTFLKLSRLANRLSVKVLFGVKIGCVNISGFTKQCKYFVAWLKIMQITYKGLKVQV